MTVATVKKTARAIDRRAVTPGSSQPRDEETNPSTHSGAYEPRRRSGDVTARETRPESRDSPTLRVIEVVESIGMWGRELRCLTIPFAVAIGAASILTAPAVRAESAPTAYVIADSVLLGAKSSLEELGFEVDAVEGRRPTRVVSAVRSLPPDGRPVIVHLGTNGPFTSDVCEELQRSVDGQRPIVFVTIHAPRTWVRESNDVIRQCAKTMPEQSASVVPWHRLAGSQADVVYPDRIHLTPKGISFLTKVLHESVADEET